MLPAMSTLEKRRHLRYPALDGVIVALNPKAEILGQMIDIGLGGLSFRYIDTEVEAPPSNELLILLNKPRFYLQNLPFRTVTDQELPNEFIFSAVSVRRMGVAFGPLTSAQRTQLEDFILYCSIINSPLKRQIDAAGESRELIRRL
jgi:hypothetical protein